MIKNFKVMDAVALSFNNNYFDLHNNFKITHLQINKRDLEIQFVSLKSDAKNKHIEIKFSELSYFESDVFPLANGYLFVSEIGYKNPEDMDRDWLLGENLSAPADHLFFRFDGDHFLRIFYQTAEVRIF